jgi:predicted deacylase
VSKKSLHIAGHVVEPGDERDLRLPISQTFTGNELSLPLRVTRATEPGPTLFVTAAVHGDEINGTGIVHELMHARRPTLRRGTLVLVPIVDLFGFETQDRYMPDRRDLNRCFPGSPKGSLSRRVADVLFREIVRQCDYGLDLHSAASGRTNFPNIRADLANTGCRRLARSFGCELIVNGRGPEGSLRRAAVRAGVPTVILEAGEPSKIEPTVLEIGVRGVLNVLGEFGMIDDEPARPPYQARVLRTSWLRAQVGGLLRFHVAPGDIVEKGQPISTNAGIFGDSQNVLVAPADGIVLGMTTLPVVKPGEPVCHLARPTKSIKRIRLALADAARGSLDRRVRRDLATNVTVTDHAMTDAELHGDAKS